MVFRFFPRLRRRFHARRVGRDPTTRALLRHGVYSVDPYPEDAELRKIKVPVPYSFWRATKTILVLSLLLWWIPTFGQMVAGYIGGRRAGSHWKAVLAALVPVLTIWSLSTLGDFLDPRLRLAFLYSLPGRALEGLAAAFPEAATWILTVLNYLRAFATALQNTLSMGVNGYMVTIIFAYIGGLMAEQSLEELEFERRGVATSPVVIHQHWAVPFGAPAAAPRAPRRHLLPWGHDEEEAPREPEGWVRVQPPSAEDLAAVEAEAAREEEGGRERERRSRLDRDLLVQRLVERALRDYERSG